MQDFAFKRAREKPEKMKEFLSRKIERALGEHFDPPAFTPPYDPWDQRLCLVPDADLFEAIKAGDAAVKTGRIRRFVADGIELETGETLEADIIVTATGLKLAVAGKIAVSVQGTPISFADHFYYKGCMFSNVPNLAVVFGYLNASWTLRADLNSAFVCRVLDHMAAIGADIAEPVLTASAEAALDEDDIFDFSSGYIQRSRHIMPKNAVRFPWRLNQEYVVDRKRMAADPVDDGLLRFVRSGSAPGQGEAVLEAAE